MKPVKNLTPCEAKVLDLVAEGIRNKQIAAQLIRSESTIEEHLDRIYRKSDLS